MKEKKENESKVIELFTDGKVKTKEGREFTRLIGGFGNDKPMFTIWQCGELLGITSREITQNYERNKTNFEKDIDYIDLKSINFSRYVIIQNLKEIGCSQNKLNATKRWLAFSLSGVLKLINISDDIFDDTEFLKKYFKVEQLPKLKLIRHEINFKEMINKSFKNIIKFTPQYICCNNKYRIDFYCKELNLAIEYDEEQHKYSQSEDKQREKEIHNELGCNFIRVIKGQEYQGINKILKYILNK